MRQRHGELLASKTVVGTRASALLVPRLGLSLSLSLSLRYFSLQLQCQANQNDVRLQSRVCQRH